jgi:transposase, IS30 family
MHSVHSLFTYSFTFILDKFTCNVKQLPKENLSVLMPSSYPLVEQGQSIHMICVTNADDIMLDEKTIYNYIDAGLLSVDNIDLSRKVCYRTRSHKKPLRVDKQCHVGRTYEDFEAYIAANPDIPVVEMDSVEGRKGGKVLLTIYFRNCSLMLSFIRDINTARSVAPIFDQLYEGFVPKYFTVMQEVRIKKVRLKSITN